jgi:hypothetical protein
MAITADPRLVPAAGVDRDVGWGVVVRACLGVVRAGAGVVRAGAGVVRVCVGVVRVCVGTEVRVGVGTKVRVGAGTRFCLVVLCLVDADAFPAVAARVRAV